MTESAVAFSDLRDEVAAAENLAAEVRRQLPGSPPDALIVFASSKYDYKKLLVALKEACNPGQLVGCSSAGEFIAGVQGENSVSALALRSTEMHFRTGIAHDLSKDRNAAAQALVSTFSGSSKPAFQYRSVLLLADALAGHTDELIEALNTLTSGGYQVFGGGAGDDARFSKTHVFHGVDAVTDAAVGLEILSHRPIGIGVQHGWQPAGEPMRVTEAEGMKLVSLNAIPAVEVFQEHARLTGQKFDPADPIPFFLHNTLGIQTRTGHKLRVPLSVGADGSINCASNIPTGATVCFMKATSASSVEAAKSAVKSALAQLEGRKPEAALFFDCVATRLRMNKEFGLELKALEKELGPEANMAGCNTYGQIARVDGQFSGFHNCTAVVCVFPE